MTARKTKLVGRRIAATAISRISFGSVRTTSVIARVAESSLPPTVAATDARIERRVEEVRGEVGDDHRDRRQHDDALDHRIVTLPDGGEQAKTDTLVREELLDDRGAADDEAHADRELRDERQHRVAP